jgi:hypothetical protein
LELSVIPDRNFAMPAMKSAPSNAGRKSRTRILFDLRDELTEDELAKFQQAARDAGAKSLTEHFLNLSIRLPQGR